MRQGEIIERLVTLLSERTRDAMGRRLSDNRIPKAILAGEAAIAKERGFRAYHVGYNYDRAAREEAP